MRRFCSYTFLFLAFFLLNFSQVDACYNETSLELLANQTNTSTELWAEIFDYFCESDAIILNTTSEINDSVLNNSYSLASFSNKTTETIALMNNTMLHNDDVLNSSVNMQLLSTLSTWKLEMMENTSGAINQTSNIVNAIALSIAQNETEKAVNQFDSVTSRLSIEKADVSSINVTEKRLETLLFNTVRANKPTIWAYVFTALASIFVSFILMFLLMKGKFPISFESGGSKFAPPHITKSASAATADPRWNLKKSELRGLQTHAALQCGRGKGELINKVWEEINEGSLKTKEDVDKSIEEHKVICDIKDAVGEIPEKEPDKKPKGKGVSGAKK